MVGKAGGVCSDVGSLALCRCVCVGVDDVVGEGRYREYGVVDSWIVWAGGGGEWCWGRMGGCWGRKAVEKVGTGGVGEIGVLAG